MCRFERFLCPNCHSQTDTFSKGDRKKKEHKYKCIDCDKNINYGFYRCIPCRSIKGRKTERPPLTQLLKDVEEFGYTGTGKKYNVCDNSIRKWIKYYIKHEKI